MLDNEEDDIADDIRKALAGDDGGDTPDPVATPAAVEADDGKAEDAAKTPAESDESPKDGRVRGPDGKFVAKAAETGQDTPDPQPVLETPQESIRPPASWSAAAKAAFLKAEPTKEDLALIQREVVKREQDVEKGFRDRATELKRYQPLEEILAPRRALWAAQNMDEASAIKTLLAAQDLLDQDPRKGLEFLARSYGVNLAQPGEGQALAPQPVGNSPNPEYTALQQELQDLRQQIASQSEAGLVSQIEAFKSDPKNLYFENVREDMAALINAGKAKTLEEAYEMSCWMRPDIRPLLQTAQVTKDPANVQKAKAAAVSITGSPAQARVPQTNATSSIEDDIRAAILEAQGQA